MPNNKYKLRYLPLFYEDLDRIVDYIAIENGNPKAAASLIDLIEGAILKRLTMPESFEVYQSKFEREHRYYRIYVENYIIFYVVLDTGGQSQIMEVRRILHKRQDRESIV